MFFGTLEIAWMSPPETMPWGDGVRAKLDQKAKSRKKFTNSVQQVRALNVKNAELRCLQAG
jgi:hypothetical protein